MTDKMREAFEADCASKGGVPTKTSYAVWSAAWQAAVAATASEATAAQQEPVASVQQEAFGRGQCIWLKTVPPDGTLLYIKNIAAPANGEVKS